MEKESEEPRWISRMYLKILQVPQQKFAKSTGIYSVHSGYTAGQSTYINHEAQPFPRGRNRVRHHYLDSFPEQYLDPFIVPSHPLFNHPALIPGVCRQDYFHKCPHNNWGDVIKDTNRDRTTPTNTGTRLRLTLTLLTNLK